MAYDLVARLTLKDKMSSSIQKVTRRTQMLQKAANIAGSTVSKFSKETNTARTRLEQFSNGMKKAESNSRNLTGNLVSLVAKIGIVAGAVKLLKTSLGGAMQMETDKLTLTALLKDGEKANQLFEMLQKKGLKSVFSEEDFLGAGKAYLPLTKDLTQIEWLVGLTERLGSSNPLEGMEGAAFSIRELLSGDYQSVVERFNIPRSTIRDALKGADTVEKKMTALDKILNDMGYTQQFVNDVNKSGSSQWQMLGSNIQTALAKMGGGALDKLSPLFEQMNTFLSGKEMTNIVNKGSDMLASGFEKLVKAGQWIIDNKNSIKDGLKTAADLSIALGGALLTAKAGFAALSIAGTVSQLLNAYRAGTLAATLATWGLNTALLVNPFTWIVVGIATAVAAGILLWRNWDLIKTKAGELVTVIGGKFNSLIEWFRTLPERIGQFMTAVGVWFTEKLPYLIGYGFGLVLGYISTLPGRIGSFLASIPGLVSSYFSSAYENASSMASNIVESVTSYFASLPERIGTFFTSVVTSISEGSQQAYEAAINWFKQIPEKVKGYFSGAIDNTLGFIGRVVSAFGGGFNEGVRKGVSTKVSGSHYHGLDKVPYDGYMARLHKGETVLPRKLADAYRATGLGGKVIDLMPKLAERANKVTYNNASTNNKNYSNVPYTTYNTSSQGIKNNANAQGASGDIQGSNKGGLQVTIAKIADSVVIREETDIEKIANSLAIRVLNAQEAGA